jgi:hypothetical protein
MLKGIKIGEKYYSIRMIDIAEPREYKHQDSELEKLMEQSGNYFKSKSECQSLCDRINAAIKKSKEKQ